MPSPVKSFQVDQLPVRSYATLADMAAAAAADAAQVLIAAVAKNGRARAIIATGNSQDLFLEKLTQRAGIRLGQDRALPHGRVSRHADDAPGLVPKIPQGARV
jgi:hypothetical protein